jgi:hypothetical protein
MIPKARQRQLGDGHDEGDHRQQLKVDSGCHARSPGHTPSSGFFAASLVPSLQREVDPAQLGRQGRSERVLPNSFKSLQRSREQCLKRDANERRNSQGGSSGHGAGQLRADCAE